MTISDETLMAYADGASDAAPKGARGLFGRTLGRRSGASAGGGQRRREHTEQGGESRGCARGDGTQGVARAAVPTAVANGGDDCRQFDRRSGTGFFHAGTYGVAAHAKRRRCARRSRTARAGAVEPACRRTITGFPRADWRELPRKIR